MLTTGQQSSQFLCPQVVPWFMVGGNFLDYPLENVKS